MILIVRLITKKYYKKTLQISLKFSIFRFFKNLMKQNTFMGEVSDLIYLLSTLILKVVTHVVKRKKTNKKHLP